MSAKINWNSPVTIIVTVLLAGGLLGGSVYVVKKYGSEKTIEKEEAKVEKEQAKVDKEQETVEDANELDEIGRPSEAETVDLNIPNNNDGWKVGKGGKRSRK